MDGACVAPWTQTKGITIYTVIACIIWGCLIVSFITGLIDAR